MKTGLKIDLLLSQLVYKIASTPCVPHSFTSLVPVGLDKFVLNMNLNIPSKKFERLSERTKFPCSYIF